MKHILAWCLAAALTLGVGCASNSPTSASDTDVAADSIGSSPALLSQEQGIENELASDSSADATFDSSQPIVQPPDLEPGKGATESVGTKQSAIPAETSEEPSSQPESDEQNEPLAEFTLDSIPLYDGEPTAIVNDDMPFFSEADFERGAFEQYSSLDRLGRCGTAFALVTPESMPVEERESIGGIRPSGWQTIRYPWVDQEYLFNRCHLIGYQLTGQNANEKNLITGTRSMNVVGMEPLETLVCSYVLSTGDSVLYRATPVFEGENLVASGVLLEAASLDKSSSGLRFCRWCYNVEPGVEIDYATGENHADGTIPDSSVEDADAREAPAEDEAAVAPPVPIADSTASADSEGASEGGAQEYVLNTNTHKFHRPYCQSVNAMKAKNRSDVVATRDEIISWGYSPCKNCNP